MKITISGQAATGTSSVGKTLAERLHYKFISGGGITRDTASKLGMDLYTFEVVSQQNPAYDLERDQSIERFGKINDDFVCEASLAWLFIPDAFKIKMICDFDVRIERLAKRDGLSIEEAKEKTLLREKVRDERWKRYYNLADCLPDDKFDMIIDSTKTSVENIVGSILSRIGK
jgi:cytidylate kinase